MNLINKPKLILALGLAPAIFGCTDAKLNSGSKVDVTDVQQTSVKHQSIGNCWAYAVVGWIESLHLTATSEHLDISETYISYWAAYEDLMDKDNLDSTDLNEGGSWALARSIILKHGYVLESEFVPEEADKSFSDRQKEALAAIKAQLQPGGRLAGKETRTRANVMKELDAAFKVQMKDMKKASHSIEELVIAAPGGKTTTLAAALTGDQKWVSVDNPQKYGVDEVPASVTNKRKNLLVRMMRALNDKLPLVISFKVGLGALDAKDGTFKLSLAQSAGLGKQGGHMVVLDDYVVDNVPDIGTLGEGDMSAAQKEAALKGTIRYFKVKNSWGVERAERGLSDGYSRIQLDYLMTNLPWDAGEEKVLSSSFLDVILPPGY